LNSNINAAVGAPRSGDPTMTTYRARFASCAPEQVVSGSLEIRAEPVTRVPVTRMGVPRFVSSNKRF
jgi:hypothetical protein